MLDRANYVQMPLDAVSLMNMLLLLCTRRVTGIPPHVAVVRVRSLVSYQRQV